MLRSLKSLIGCGVHAKDGDIGMVRDALFDDWVWTLRYWVVRPGSWLDERRVLISPASMETPQWNSKKLPVTLTREQIRNAPVIDDDAPVSRQNERELAAYFQWPAYWAAGGFGVEMTGLAEPVVPVDVPDVPSPSGDPHLQSAAEVMGYALAGKTESLGRINDLLLDDDVWAIRFAVVETDLGLRPWKILIASEWITSMDWAGRKAICSLSAKDVASSAEYRPDDVLDRRRSAVSAGR